MLHFILMFHKRNSKSLVRSPTRSAAQRMRAVHQHRCPLAAYRLRHPHATSLSDPGGLIGQRQRSFITTFQTVCLSVGAVGMAFVIGNIESECSPWLIYLGRFISQHGLDLNDSRNSSFQAWHIAANDWKIAATRAGCIRLLSTTRKVPTPQDTGGFPPLRISRPSLRPPNTRLRPTFLTHDTSIHGPYLRCASLPVCCWAVPRLPWD